MSSHLLSNPDVFSGNMTIAKKFINRIKTNGNIRKTSWMHKMLSSNRLYNFDSYYADEYADVFDKMTTVLNRVYNQNWDYHYVPVRDSYDNIYKFEIYILIYYPEVLIKNSSGNQHLIQDLLVNLKLKSNTNDDGSIGIVPERISGSRTSFDYLEWNYGYNHSHLKTYKPDSYRTVFKGGSFCLGEATEIVELQSLLYDNFSEDLFEMFLFTLNSMVEWESLEGVPYKKISKIILSDDKYRVSCTSLYDLKSYFRQIEDHIGSDFKPDFLYKTGIYGIRKNDKFLQLLKNIVLNHLQDNWKKLLVNKKSDGSYYGYSHPSIQSEEDLNKKYQVATVNGYEIPYVQLRDKQLKFKVRPLSGIEVPDPNDYTIHPNLINYAAEQLEQQLYYQSVRKSTIERYHQTINA